MSPFRRLPALAKASIAALTIAAPLAMAGHTNTVLKADLDGREEVNTTGTNAIVGDPNGRGEIYVFGIDGLAGQPNPNPNVLCYVLTVKKIAELQLPPGMGRAAHIHSGKRGANGPVVANIAWPQDGQSADCLDATTQSARFPMGNGQFIIADIKANPQNYYVNVHNSVYPSGAIRGQLAYVGND